MSAYGRLLEIEKTKKRVPRKHVKKNLKKYTEVVFESAMEAIKNGLSIRQAAKQL